MNNHRKQAAQLKKINIFKASEEPEQKRKIELGVLMRRGIAKHFDKYRKEYLFTRPSEQFEAL